MSNQRCFLLIRERESYWHEFLREALCPLGVVEAASKEEALYLVEQRSYAAIIIDTVEEDENISLLITKIKKRDPLARVVVATSSPTWSRAREAFHAGAVDYIRRSLDGRELRSIVELALLKTLSR